jgi:hypothetical protein
MHPTNMRGRTAGTFQIQDKLGEGGMGAVYRAVDIMVERTVAVKVLKPEISGNPEVVERFRTEAITLARLNHPSIATLYTFFREGADYFMVMEFVSGSTLEDAIRGAGAMPWRQAVDVLLRILEALEHAHQYGVLHRDIKPANIMLPKTGGVKVTDFGIAQVLGAARLTREGRMVGTLEYLAPERIVGKPFDERSDLYSAGVVFYEMLSGHLPFESDSDYGLIRAQTEAPPPPIENFGVNVPRPILEVLWRSLAKLPEQRYANAAGMAAALREARARAEGEIPAAVQPVRETRMVAPAAIVHPAPTQWQMAPAASQPMPPPAAMVAPANGSSRLLWAAGAVVFVILLAGAGFLVLRTVGAPPAQTAKQLAPVNPDASGPADAARREPIVTVGPPVVLGDGQPSPSPAPARSTSPSASPKPAPTPARSPDPTPTPPQPVPQSTPQPTPQPIPQPAPAPPVIAATPASGAGARAAIGVRGIYVAGQAARSLQLAESGLLIQEIQRGSGAEAAGLRGPISVTNIGGTNIGIGGDLITAIDGQPIQNQESPARILTGKHPGDAVMVTVLRAGRNQNVPMRLSEASEASAQPQVLSQTLPQAQPQPGPITSTIPSPRAAPASAAPPVPTGQRIEVVHDHGGLANKQPWPACRGYLQTIGNELVYVVQASSDGRNDNFHMPLTELQEVKVNLLPIRNLQAFHIKVNGKSFNFIPTQFSTVQAVAEIQRAMARR